MTIREPEEDKPGAEPVENEVVSDRSLLRRLQNGQPDAPTRLYLRYAERLHALAASRSPRDLTSLVNPEDIVQSVFRTFFRRAAQGHYTVPDGEEIWKLLLVISLNKIRTAGTHHRAAKRDARKTTRGEAFDRAMEATSGRDENAMTILRMVIAELLDGLPEPHCSIIELRIEGHEVSEIAEKVRRSKRSVERVLQDFRTRLAASIRED